jgi:hypothetical protein
MTTTTTKKNKESLIGLNFSHGEWKLILEPGKTKYLMMVKGFTKKEAELMPVSTWARDLVWSVAKAYHEK